MSKYHSRFLYVLVVLCSLCCCTRISPAQNYGEKLDSRWRGILGLREADGAYRWFGYPANSFGVMTLYSAPSGKQLTDADRICATWTCLGVDPARIPSDEFPFTTVNGFADTRLRSPFELANNKEGRAAVSLLLSNLFRALEVDGPVNLSKTVTFDLRASQVYRRSINPARFRSFLESPSNPRVRNAWNSGQLTYIGSDVVARGLRLTINVDPATDPAIDAQFTRAIAKLGRDGASGVLLHRAWHGTYVVQFSEFVVLATQMRHQSPPRTNPGIESATRFQASTSTVPIPNLDPTTLRVTAGE